MNIADDLAQAYKDGEWEMFQLITSAWYGKQTYFKEPNGTVYSRETCRYLKDMDDAVNEFLRKIYYG